MSTSQPSSTPDLVEKVMHRRRRSPCIPPGIEHGTLTVVCRWRALRESPALRQDVETDGRRATVVAFTDDWALEAPSAATSA
jgi:tRNA nucleotidyltransferase/poly(A) polymerase